MATISGLVPVFLITGVGGLRAAMGCAVGGCATGGATGFSGVGRTECLVTTALASAFGAVATVFAGAEATFLAGGAIFTVLAWVRAEVATFGLGLVELGLAVAFVADDDFEPLFVLAPAATGVLAFELVKALFLLSAAGRGDAVADFKEPLSMAFLVVFFAVLVVVLPVAGLPWLEAAGLEELVLPDVFLPTVLGVALPFPPTEVFATGCLVFFFEGGTGVSPRPKLGSRVGLNAMGIRGQLRFLPASPLLEWGREGVVRMNYPQYA